MSNEILKNIHGLYIASKAKEWILCLPCVIFGTKDNLIQFICIKFKLWSQQSVKLAAHDSKQYHRIALSTIDAFKLRIFHWQSFVNSIKHQKQETKCITEAILLCGRHCISLRGHCGDNTADVDCNKGNFLALPNKVLAKHFYEAGKNTK